MKKIFWAILVCLASITSHAQIGYQVSLLNTATGEPRANVTVNATVTITDSENGLIYTGTQKATSNDFGVLSLTIGNADTFKNVDFAKLPFFIAVSIDGTLIGKSQILSVPVAEVSKALAPAVSLDELCRKEWVYASSEGFRYSYIKFEKDGEFIDMTVYYDPQYEPEWRQGIYEMRGNQIICYYIENGYTSQQFHAYSFYWHNGKVWRED